MLLVRLWADSKILGSQKLPQIFVQESAPLTLCCSRVNSTTHWFRENVIFLEINCRILKFFFKLRTLPIWTTTDKREQLIKIKKIKKL